MTTTHAAGDPEESPWSMAEWFDRRAGEQVSRARRLVCAGHVQVADLLRARAVKFRRIAATLRAEAPQ